MFSFMQKIPFLILFFLLFNTVLYSQKQTEDSLKTIIKSKPKTDTTYLLSLAELANISRYSQPDSSLVWAKEVLETSKSLNYQTGIGRGARVIGIYYRTKGNVIESIKYLNIAVDALQKSNDLEGLGFTYNSLAALYKNQSKSPLAVEYCQKAITAFEKINNQKGVAYASNNLADIYKEQGNLTTALAYAKKSLVLNEQEKDKKGIFYSNFNIAEIYQQQKQYDKALSYQLTNLKLAEETNDQFNLTYACNNIANAQISLKQYDKALPYLEKGLKAALEMKSLERQTDLNITFAKYYQAIKQPQTAFKYANDAVTLAKNLNNIGLINLASYEKSHIAASLGNYEEAYQSHLLYKATTDSLQNQKKYKDALQKDFDYQQNKQELEKQQTQLNYQKELQAQKNIRNIFITAFGFMIALAITGYVLYQNKKKTNLLLAIQNNAIIQQQEELLVLNDNLETQKNTLETTYSTLKTTSEQLNKSIAYASRMQNIILPEMQDLKAFFQDIFIIYKPKDIVSGDFYWFSKINDNKCIFVLADCTGHGVPGAFMSLLGSTLLHEIINTKQIYNDPATILALLDKDLRILLKQEQGLNNDGIDISVCFFEKNTRDTKNIKLTFAGAKSFMYYVENNQINQISGDKIYLGGKDKPLPFTNQVFDFEENTMFYLLSDGIIDQNDPERRKLGSNAVKQTTLQHHKESMKTQQEQLLALLAAHQAGSEQRDDISMIGLKMF